LINFIVFFLFSNYLAAYADRYKEDDTSLNRFNEFVKTTLKLGKNTLCKRQGRKAAAETTAKTAAEIAAEITSAEAAAAAATAATSDKQAI
jgi:hypothetical protein